MDLGTKLKGEVTLLTQEKVKAESEVDRVLAEISEFEEGVRLLEKDMQDLTKLGKRKDTSELGDQSR